MTMAGDPAGRADGRRPDATRTNRWLVATAAGVLVAWAALRIGGEPPDLTARLTVHSVPYALALAALVGVVTGMDARKRSAALAVVTGTSGTAAFRAGPHRTLGWFSVVLLMSFGTLVVGPVDQWAEASAEGLSWYLGQLYLVPFTALFAAVLGAQVVAVVRGRTGVGLTPTGVEVREPFGARTIPWAALAPGTPGAWTAGRALDLDVRYPDLVTGWGLRWGSRRSPRIGLDYVNVHPGFLADVLRHYVDHPDERAGIGTPAGYDRLRRALGEDSC
ncbi:hypothetical protein AWW66_13420 [Micromonospora rosaria]|uniref:PH domain-containing protein n=1 Tax=Micromonospora rosaria TaxID=47874 RepID=A0A136PSP2_9ACTN|nr:PH domain-containing protein [Micromonospora rosaria]KXK61491.1 hypothetical protein AWW66_13420 [Micromonospora rosaria]